MHDTDDEREAQMAKAIEEVARSIQNADRATELASACPQEGAANDLAEDVSDWGAFLASAAISALAAHFQEKAHTLTRATDDTSEDLKNKRAFALDIAAAIRAALEE